MGRNKGTKNKKTTLKKIEVVSENPEVVEKQLQEEEEIKEPKEVVKEGVKEVPVVKENSLLKKLVGINALLDSVVIIKTTTGTELKGRLVNIAYDNIFVLTSSGNITRCSIKMISSCKKG